MKIIIDNWLAIVNLCIVTYIAFQQLRLEKVKFDMSLYDKRFAIYLSLKETLGLVSRNAKLSYSEVEDCRIKTLEAEFLFDDEKVIKKVKELYKKFNKLASLSEQTEDPLLDDNSRNDKINNKKRDLVLELVDDHEKLKSLFVKVLSVR